LALQKGFANAGVNSEGKFKRCFCLGIAVTRNKFFHRAVFVEHMAADFANVGSVHVDADGGLVCERVPHAMYIANRG
jgi:hypothetical protein